MASQRLSVVGFLRMIYEAVREGHRSPLTLIGLTVGGAVFACFATPSQVSLPSALLAFVLTLIPSCALARLVRIRRGQAFAWKGRSIELVSLGAAVAILGTVYSLLASHWAHDAPNIFYTAPDQTRVLHLPDGSTALLSGSTEVDVRYDEKSRDLILRRGAARFSVAYDRERTFQVTMNDVLVKATGAVFDARLDADGQSAVRTIEGSVEMSSKALRTSTSEPLIVHLRPSMGIALREDTSTTKPSWRSGTVSFDREPFQRVVWTLNFFSPSKWLIEDPMLDDIGVAGAFNVSDLSTLTQALAHLGVQERVIASGWGQEIHLARSGRPSMLLPETPPAQTTESPLGALDTMQSRSSLLDLPSARP